MLAGQAVTGRYQLALGPWFHNPAGMGLAIQQVQLAWFDRWLKGRRNGIASTRTPLHAFELSSGRWIDTRDYPFAETHVARYYLGPGRTGTAGTSLNDGSLRGSPPRSGRDTIRFSDAQSPCSRAIDQWNTGLGAYLGAMAGLPPSPCSTNDTSTQAGALTYTSAPLSAPVTLAGPIDATLYLDSTTRDAEVVVSLSDVAPSGASYPLTAGALLGSLRAVQDGLSWRGSGGRLLLPYHPYSESSARDLVPGRTERLDVEVYPTFARLATGHRLRLTVTTGGTALQPSPAQLVHLAGGEYGIARGGTDASFVDLPLASPSAFRRSPIDWGGCNGGC